MQNLFFIAGHFTLSTTANVLLKLSAGAPALAPFLVLQIAGNLTGFVGVLSYTGLLKHMPLHLAFPITQGLAALGILFAASILVFHEPFTLTEAAGCAIVVVGVVLVGFSKRLQKPAAGAHREGDYAC